MWFGRRSPIAIDFGDHAVKVLQLERCRGNLRVGDARWVELEPSQGGADTHERLLRAARKAIDLGTFHGRAAISALPLYETSTQHVRIASRDLPKLDELLAQEVEERFPEREGEITCQSIPVAEIVERGERQQELLCCFAEQAPIEDLVLLLAELGLEPVAIDLDSCAQLRPFWFLRRREEDQQAHAYIDVGEQATRLTVALGPRPVLMNLVPLGGRHLLETLRSTLRIGPEELHEILRAEEEVDEDSSIDIRASIASVLSAQLDILVRRLRECIRYFGSIFAGQGVESLRFVGGATDLPGMIEGLSKRIGIAGQRGDPFRILGMEPPDLPPRVAPETFATSLGLALRGLDR